MKYQLRRKRKEKAMNKEKLKILYDHFSLVIKIYLLKLSNIPNFKKKFWNNSSWMKGKVLAGGMSKNRMRI